MADDLSFGATGTSSADDGLDFGGSPQPPSVPPDPTGENWRGPQGVPGPPGPPGPTGPAGGGAVIIAASPPVGAAHGTLWWDSTRGNLYVRYDDGSSAQYVVAVNQIMVLG